MEESRNPGGNKQKDNITTKLPPEATVPTSTTTKLPYADEPTRQTPAVVDTMQLVVIEGIQVGRGVARIDTGDMTQMGCQPGDIVLITGARTTAAKLVPTSAIDRRQKVIQMDSQVRQNCASGLNERVTIRKAHVRDAEKITLLPLNSGTPIQESDLQYIARYLVGLPVVIGDLLRVGTPGTAPREFLIINTSPATPSYTLKKRSSGDLDELASELQNTERAETEAVVVQTGTLVKAQMRGAGKQSTKGHVSYEDIGGLGKELQRIREMIELPLKYPAVFDRLGVEPPKGVLLYGPPGTGKTLIARVVAAETNATFFVINGPEIINKFYGESESKLRSVFQEAQRQAPSIIFIDELDALAPKRAETGGEVERRIVGQLLALMDGLSSRGQIVLIGATNQPNALDPALRRPGRFDREIALRVPDVRGRTDILRIHSKDAALANDVDLARIAQLTPGFVGADLESLCREAAMIALRRVLPHIDYQRGYIPYETLVSLNITMADFQAALREVEPSTTREVYVEVSDTTWDDIGGLEKVKSNLTEGVEWPLRYPEIYANVKVEPPRGVLLSGPPGSGKTLIARALAHQCEANFVSIKGPELLSKWVGESEKGVREVFRRAKQAAPCLVFFDELDAMAPRRGGDINSQVSDRVIAQLLTEMDGIEGREGVIVIAATNRPELIDPALLRPGRFDLIVEIGYPNTPEREAIFGIHTRNRPLAEDVHLNVLAAQTEGRSGADIEAICRRASLLALREWIAPKVGPNRILITEEPQISAQAGTASGGSTGATAGTASSEPASPVHEEIMPGDQPHPTGRFQVRLEHFQAALDEQNERYTIQATADAERKRKEAGQQRLLDMATGYKGSQDGPDKPPLRGFWLWLARVFGRVA